MPENWASAGPGASLGCRQSPLVSLAVGRSLTPVSSISVLGPLVSWRCHQAHISPSRPHLPPRHPPPCAGPTVSPETSARARSSRLPLGLSLVLVSRPLCSNWHRAPSLRGRGLLAVVSPSSPGRRGDPPSLRPRAPFPQRWAPAALLWCLFSVGPLPPAGCGSGVRRRDSVTLSRNLSYKDSHENERFYG